MHNMLTLTHCLDLRILCLKSPGSKHFTKIDLSEAYLQMEVDEQSRKYFVIATAHWVFSVQEVTFWS